MEENDTVVDPRLRVHGVGRLRVVYAAIMPTVPGREHERADDHDCGGGFGHDTRGRTHDGVNFGHRLI